MANGWNGQVGELAVRHAMKVKGGEHAFVLPILKEVMTAMEVTQVLQLVSLQDVQVGLYFVN